MGLFGDGLGGTLDLHCCSTTYLCPEGLLGRADLGFASTASGQGVLTRTLWDGQSPCAEIFLRGGGWGLAWRYQCK